MVTSGEWFQPTEFARGPWDPEQCHAGPPSALMARAAERAVPDQQLVRLTVELQRPVPMEGFAVEADPLRIGRGVSSSRVRIVDADGRVRATATALHMSRLEQPLAPGPAFDGGLGPIPSFDDAADGDFPFRIDDPELTGFRDAVRMRYPGGVAPGFGSAVAWMRSAAIIDGEKPSPFQRVCPLADCTNAFSRHADGSEIQFMNADLSIFLHREPVNDWLGTRATAVWQPHGVGVAEALLLDECGPVGWAMQTLFLRPAR